MSLTFSHPYSYPGLEGLKQRQKQINFGKNTIGYTRYCELVPRNQRKLTDPQTPKANKKMSKRSFAGSIKAWRRQLHEYDGTGDNMEEVAVATIQKEQQQQQQQQQQQLVPTANARTPGNSRPASHQQIPKDEFDDLDLASYGLTREEIEEAAKDDPTLLELLVQHNTPTTTSTGNSTAGAAGAAQHAQPTSVDGDGDEQLVDYDFDGDDDLL